MNVEDYILIGRRKYYFSEWLTLSAYAKQYGIRNISALNNWLYRGVIPEDDHIVIEELNGLSLIRNKEYKPRTYNKKES